MSKIQEFKWHRDKWLTVYNNTGRDKISLHTSCRLLKKRGKGLEESLQKKEGIYEESDDEFQIPLVFAVLMIPAVVEAESINAWPDQLKPVNPTVAYMQSVDEARNGLFYAPIYLRVGAKIVKVNYHHLGARSPALTAAKLMRVKMGEVPQKLADKSSSTRQAKSSRWMFLSRASLS